MATQTPAQSPDRSTPKPQPTRRDIMRGAAVAGAAVMAAGSNIPFVHAAEDNTIKIGLVGCGGRGSGAAGNALNADKNIKLWAMGDMFKDQLDQSLNLLKRGPKKSQIDVAPERQFTGWDAYKGVIAECDVVLLATAPFFRPMHLEAVLNAGKHCFCEKPVATDPTNLRLMWDTAKKFKEKKLSLVSGLCYRYDEAKIETVQRIRDGAVGDYLNLQGMYLTGDLWTRPRKPEWTDMEWQVRNWLYFTWLSGDMIVEQHIHTLDKMMWLMGDEPPVSCIASGGRTVRTQPEFGNIFDHFCTVYEWKNGVRAFCHARQWAKTDADVSDWVYGTKGKASLMDHQIWGENAWKRKASKENMYDSEHVALFKSIRNNEPIYNGDYMCKSTLVGIMGRMAAYTGKKVTWDQVINSSEDLRPAKLEWGPYPTPEIAVPGKTKLAPAIPAPVTLKE
jgi:predicted dehydrogenase